MAARKPPAERIVQGGAGSMAQPRVPVEDQAAASSQRGGRPEPKPGGSRVVWVGSRLLVVAVLLRVLVYCAPLLIGGLGLWKTVLSTAAPALANQITISSLKLAWFSPIE